LTSKDFGHDTSGRLTCNSAVLFESRGYFIALTSVFTVSSVKCTMCLAFVFVELAVSAMGVIIYLVLRPVQKFGLTGVN
jgi:hypothetical protein